MTPGFKSFLQRWLINTLAVLVATYFVRGIRYGSGTDLCVATLILGVLNAFLRPLLMKPQLLNSLAVLQNRFFELSKNTLLVIEHDARFTLLLLKRRNFRTKRFKLMLLLFNCALSSLEF